MPYDFHTHSIHSDGVLTVAELVRRAEIRGYKVLGITDHVDPSNLEDVIAKVTKACRALRGHVGILYAGAFLSSRRACYNEVRDGKDKSHTYVEA